MQNEILKIILIGAIIHGFVLAIFLYFTKGRKLANRFMAGIVFLFSVSLFEEYAILTATINRFPFLSNIVHTFPLIYGPLFYLYAYYLTNGGKKFRKMDFLHFLPGIFNIIFAFFVLSNSIKTGSELEQASGSFWHVFWIIEIAISAIVYSFLGISVVSKFQRNIRNQLSNIEHISLKWLKWSFVILLSLWAITFAMFGLNLSKNSTWIYFLDFLSYIMALFIFSVSYLALWQPDIFAIYKKQSTVKKVTNISNEDIHAVESKSEIKNLKEIQNLEENLEKMENFMKSQKPWLRSDLSRDELADELGISPNELTYIINHEIGLNFFNYINKYRIEYVKELLIEPEMKNLTILAIAYEAGFNSKSTFNTMFKKFTGQTPSQWRKNAEK